MRLFNQRLPLPPKPDFNNSVIAIVLATSVLRVTFRANVFMVKDQGKLPVTM